MLDNSINFPKQKMTTTEESQTQPNSNPAWDYLFSLERPTPTRNWLKSIRAWFSPIESIKLSFEECKRQMLLNLDRAAELSRLETSVNLKSMEVDLAFAITTLSCEINHILRLSLIYTTNSSLLSVLCLWVVDQPKHYYLIVLSLNLLVFLGIYLFLRWRELSEKETLEYYEHLVKLAQIET